MMTGTASELCESNEFFNNKLSNTDLFSAWLFGKINADCLLSDISQDGCSILIPKKHPPLKETFNLIIMSPDDNEKVHTILAARQCWSNNLHSTTHIKTGIEFLDITKDLLTEINLLITYFTYSDHSSAPLIKCSTLNR